MPMLNADAAEESGRAPREKLGAVNVGLERFIGLRSWSDGGG